MICKICEGTGLFGPATCKECAGTGKVAEEIEESFLEESGEELAHAPEESEE